jgi:hypothetical protein
MLCIEDYPAASFRQGSNVMMADVKMPDKKNGQCHVKLNTSMPSLECFFFSLEVASFFVVANLLTCHIYCIWRSHLSATTELPGSSQHGLERRE